MTKLLEKAFSKASQLSPEDQDAFADWMLQELESEQKWSESFAKSQDTLEKLANEALAEHRAGETLDLDLS